MVWTIVISYPSNLKAQFTPEPQALTQEEYDQYLDTVSLTDPNAVVASAESFEKAFPKSAMLPKVYRTELDAWNALGNVRMAILVGEKILRLAPENVDVMSEVAYLTADTVTDAENLRKARAFGLRALELVEKLQIPRSISPQEWSKMRGSLEGRAHSALGLVAFKSGMLEESIAQFELALRSGAADDTSVLYRLGVTYRLAGFQEKAREALTRAAASGDPEIRRRAEQELRRLPP